MPATARCRARGVPRRKSSWWCSEPAEARPVSRGPRDGSADTRQLLAGKKIENAARSEHRVEDDTGRLLRGDAADATGFPPGGQRPQAAQSAGGIGLGNEGHEAAFVGDVERIEAEDFAGSAHRFFDR